MGQFSTTNLFGMTIRESATDGSDFTNPDADYRRLFLGEDGQLHLKDSAGSVTDVAAGSGIAATIFDAKGDIIVATAADTAARKAAGTNGFVLHSESGQSDGLLWKTAKIPSSKVIYTGGDITTATSGTDKQAFHASGLDVTIAAATGDVLEWSASFGLSGNNTGELRVDAATVVSSTLTNFFSGGTITAGSIMGLYLQPSVSVVINASCSIMYTVQAGDISAGNVTIRPVYIAAANAKTLKAQANYPAYCAVKNLGQ